MRFITDIKEIQIQSPNYFISSCSYEDIYLWEIGYRYMGSIEDIVYILKDMSTNEIFKISKEVFEYLLSVGEGINNSY